MRYREALRVLEERGETRIRLGLARMRRHLAVLGEPQEAYRSIHVAGTNGKGSVCAMLDSVLRSGGLRAGLYSSPHLSDPRERVAVDGRPIAPEAFARCLGRALLVERRLGERLTYFEMLTSVAFQHFKDAGVRIAVIETGLGGRFDATNVVRRPLAAAVPTIDYDHAEFLGDTLASIAREKAGIFKRGTPAFTAELKPAALQALRAAVRRCGGSLFLLPGRPAWEPIRTDWTRCRQTLRGPNGEEFELGLLGPGQARNAALVLEVLSELRAAGLPVSEEASAHGLAQVRWPGRFEVVRRAGETVILDGAHNPQAARHFRRTLESSPWRSTAKRFVFGALRDKRHEEMARILGPLMDGQEVLVTRPKSPRALEPGVLAHEVARWAPRAKISVLAVPEEALSMRGGKRRVLCVCGSFYLIGAARRCLGLRP